MTKECTRGSARDGTKASLDLSFPQMKKRLDQVEKDSSSGDLSSPQMNKLLGQVEKYSSNGDGMQIAINPTISVTISTANQSATRVLGQMQATVNET
jgi:hypothetical protein